ncbi:GlxA family transcriptional regulator [Salinarimonas ramus]|uniref:AraC family transcriptional regulator n=1 Tax=Salinarimonas ramus TaxID=690164 RepID=A0A917QBY2_9HYPH|nr:GlxA family transcriptional regulator [Salinarimonas ramus]GGK42555.1 AraC family transcriptional regulator [Salinarimonas ramus]
MLAATPGSPLALRVGFVLAHDFTLSALSLFVDPLRLAADEGDRSRPIRCSWAIMAPTTQPVRSSCGLLVSRTAPLGEPSSFDYVVVVGGLLHSGHQVDATTEAWLRRAAAAGVPLVGVCTGSFVLARAGLMRNRRACVSWYHHADYETEFADTDPISDRLFLVDRDRITCAGGAGVADLAAFLIEKHLGRGVAQKALHVLLLQHARAASDAQPHALPVERIGDPRVERAVRLMEQSIAEPLTIEEIASRLALSTRQLERLFQARLRLRPAVVYRQLRLRHARWLLENTRKPVTAVAVETGFCDAAHFSRQFKSYFNLSPSIVRGARPAATPSVEAAE